MTDDRFERELRGFLAERAPGGAVSPALRARIQAVASEPPVRSGGWIGGLGDAWRAGMLLAGTVAVAVVLLVLLSRVDALRVRDPGPIGAPSAAPGLIAPLFITAPADLFTPVAVADAERRLEAVYAGTGVEARLFVTPQASGTQLSAPDGWPERFDRDGRPDRDILAVAGIAPDGAPVCCLTLAGDLILRARDVGVWRPTDQPAALDGDLAGSTAEFRDVALDRFVRGVEDMAPRLDELETAAWNNDDIQRTAGLLAVLVPLLLLGFVGLRRRSATPVTEPGSTAGGLELVEVAPMAALDALADASLPATAHAPTLPVTTTPLVPWEGDDGATVARYGLPRWPAWAVRSDRTWILIAFAAIAALGTVGVIDLLLPATTSVRLDPSLDGIGVRPAGVSLVPIALIGIVLASLLAYARQGRWRRRFGVLVLVALVGWTMSVVVDQTTPVSRDRDRGWVSGGGGEVAFGMGGLMENVTYRVAPGQPFTMATTIRNPGVLPVTVLGLDGIRTSQPNPYVASIVSLGWVPQPTDGAITFLSATAEDASASWPVTLAPGEELAIVIVGRGGPCADAQGIIADLPLARLGIRYRVLGLERTTDIGLPAAVFVTGKDPCTVETPGGTGRYSNPDD
jgi:hypothetical protein